MARDLRISVIVCAHNETRYLPACVHSVLGQSRPPDEVLVINNASTEATAVVAAQIPFVAVIDEPRKGLVVARETGRRHASGDIVIRAYDLTVAPATQLLVKHILRIGTIFYGANFAVRRDALEQIGGFDTSIEFHGEDTNVGRRLSAIGKVGLFHHCYLHTSARRFIAMGKRDVFRLYVRNFVSELLHHRPKDTAHMDIRI